MATATIAKVKKPLETVADLRESLGRIPLQRIRLNPPLGKATEKDVIAARQSAARLRCELVEGILVEKPMGTREALLAALIVHYFWDYLEEKEIGIALGADGFVRLWPGRVRIPDVSFFSFERLPGGDLPAENIASVVPDLAVEVLSESNTKQEIKLKLQEYFQAGVRLAWVVDRKKQLVDVYTTATQFERLDKTQTLNGGDVLPGFSLSLPKLFRRHGNSGKRR